MNRSLLVAALVTGLLCGIWAGIAPALNLSIWAGFATCTAYFALGKRSPMAMVTTALTAVVGVLTALLMIVGSDVLGGSAFATGLAVGVVVVFIVLMGAVNWLAFVPGIFVGCYSTFAMGVGVEGMFGPTLWVLLGSLIAGSILGYLCDTGGNLVNNMLHQPEEPAVM